MPSLSRNHRNTFRAKLTARNVFDIRQLAATLPAGKVAKAQYIQDALKLYGSSLSAIGDVIAGRSFVDDVPAERAQGAYKL